MPTIFNPSGKNGRALRLTVALLIVYLVWGTTYYALDLAMASLPPLLMNGARFMAAGLVMLAIARCQGLAWPTVSQWRHCALIGLMMACGAMGLIVLAQQWGIGSGLMATVVTTMPMWLALWTRWGGEAVPRTSWAGLVLGVAGALVLALEGDFSATLAGTLCAFGAPLCWSLGSYASRKLALPAPAMASGAQWLIGGSAGVAIALALEPATGQLRLADVTAQSWLAWVYLVVMGTLVTLNAYLWLLQNSSAALAGSYAFVNPVVALCVGVAMGGEQLTGWVFVAMPLILLALALILYGKNLSRWGATAWARFSQRTASPANPAPPAGRAQTPSPTAKPHPALPGSGARRHS